jgi:hypothetical protein
LVEAKAPRRIGDHGVKRAVEVAEEIDGVADLQLDAVELAGGTDQQQAAGFCAGLFDRPDRAFDRPGVAGALLVGEQQRTP